MEHKDVLALWNVHSLGKIVTPQVLDDIYLVNLEVAREARLKVSNDAKPLSVRDIANTSAMARRAITWCRSILTVKLISGLITQSEQDKRIQYDLSDLDTFFIQVPPNI